MSDTPIGDIVGRHDSATPASETGAASGGVDTAVQPAQASGETSGADGQAAETVDPVAGLKSALDKERDRASRFEKDFKKSERARQQEAAALRRELESLRAMAPKPDPKAAEDEFWASSPPEFVNKRLSEVEQRFEQRLTRERVESSKEYARDRYEDFEDVEAAFIEAATKDPSLWTGVNESQAPALVVYKRGKQLLAGTVSGPDARIAKLEAEIAELRAGRDGGQTEAVAETAAASTQKPSVPRSNAGIRGSGVGKTTAWAGPTPIENVFGRRRSAR